MDKLNLPASTPVLDVLFTLNGDGNFIVPLGIDKRLQRIGSCEARKQSFTMLEDAPRKVGGDADVKRSVRLVRHDADPATSHIRTFREERHGWPVMRGHDGF